MSTEVLLDLESGSVGMSVVTDGVLSCSNRREFARETGADAHAYVPQLRTALAEVLKADVRPSRVRVMISSPWYHGVVTHHVRDVREPTRFALSSIRSSVPEAEHAGIRVESGPTAIFINGYQTMVSEPVLGRTVLTRSYTSFIDAETEAVLVDAVARVWPHTPLSFYTLPSLVSKAGVRDALFIRAGAESTDVCLLVGDSLAQTSRVPHGWRSVARQAKPHAIDDAESRFSLFVAGSLKEAEAVRTSSLLLTASEAWRAGLAVVLSEFGEADALPRSVVLLAEGAPWFQRVIELSAMERSVSLYSPKSTDAALEFFARAIV